MPEAVAISGWSTPLVAGVASAAISAWLTITVLLRYVAKHSFGVFAVYRLVLALVIVLTIAAR
jgi:undecaprenyl-diphosphatase